MWGFSELIVAIMVVKQLPPRLSRSIDVRSELRYGICVLAFSDSATITLRIGMLCPGAINWPNLLQVMQREIDVRGLHKQLAAHARLSRPL